MKYIYSQETLPIPEGGECARTPHCITAGRTADIFAHHSQGLHQDEGSDG